MRVCRALFPKRATPKAYRRAAARYHRRAIELLKRQARDLRNSIAALSVVMIALSVVAQPPVPSPQFDLGKQSPYLTTTTIWITQTVTTAHSLKVLRVIDREGDKLDTNYSILKTNYSVSVTNTTPLTP